MRTLMVLTLAILAIGFGIIGPAPPPALADTTDCAQAAVIAAVPGGDGISDQPVIALDIGVKTGMYKESDFEIVLNLDGTGVSPPTAITTAVATNYLNSDMLKLVWATSTAPRASPPLTARPAANSHAMIAKIGYDRYSGAAIWHPQRE